MNMEAEYTSFGSLLPSKASHTESATESHLTSTAKISRSLGEDNFLVEFVCFLFQFCPFDKPKQPKPTNIRPRKCPGISLM